MLSAQEIISCQPYRPPSKNYYVHASSKMPLFPMIFLRVLPEPLSFIFFCLRVVFCLYVQYPVLKFINFYSTIFFHVLVYTIVYSISILLHNKRIFIYAEFIFLSICCLVGNFYLFFIMVLTFPPFFMPLFSFRLSLFPL